MFFNKKINNKTTKEQILSMSFKCSDLVYINKKLYDDKDIILKAIEDSGLALDFASSRLKKDPEVVKAAFRSREHALYFASHDLLDDELFIEELMQISPNAIIYASYRIYTYVFLKLKDQILNEISDSYKKNERENQVTANIIHDPNKSESCFAFRSKTNEEVTFDETEFLIILKTIKTIVRTYLKMKDLFTFNFKKKRSINNENNRV